MPIFFFLKQHREDGLVGRDTRRPENLFECLDYMPVCGNESIGVNNEAGPQNLRIDISGGFAHPRGREPTHKGNDARLDLAVGIRERHVFMP